MRVYKVASGVVMLSLITVATVAPRQGLASQPGVSECPSDIVGNGVIDAADVVAVVLSLGPCRDCAAELTGDGVVDAMDVMAVVANLGGCASIDDPVALAGGAMHICAVEDDSFATADGGCKDMATGLVWGVIGINRNWPTSVDLIADSVEAGFTDWRMPTRNEWLEVINNGAANHFGSGHAVTGGARYWSSTTQGNRAWSVVIATGESFKNRKTDFLHFTGVRDSDGGDPPDPPGGFCNNDGICDPGEDCETCGNDCDSKTNGPPSGRYCCGNGVVEGPEGDGRCDGNP
ncbi:MAG: DUF1566 domain-containing protein [Planctomycetota bacterium]|nr:MAG: DUF1566 domain-containing protein [Planctomycetota bacterium]